MSATGQTKTEIKTIDLGGEIIETISSTSEFDRDKYDIGERFRQDTNDRKILTRWVICTVSVWLGLVIILLFCIGRGLEISDTVACVLLGTTTLNILGLAYIVLKGLFPESKSK